jgi:hypothetical protein
VDTFGNPLSSAYAFGFRTTDTLRPTVLNTIPLNGATHVKLVDSVFVTFSKAISPASLLFTSAPAVTWSDTVWNAAQTQVTLVHALPLALNTAYSINITMARDTFNNAIATPYGFGFRTTDTLRPVVIATTPVNGATHVKLVDSVFVTFSKAINPGSLAFTSAPAVTWSDTVWNGAQTQVTLVHALPLALNTSYSINITMARDTFNNVIASQYAFGFRTLADTQAPSITYAAPTGGGVARNASVVIGFSEPMNTPTVTVTSRANPGGWSQAWNSRRDTVTILHNPYGYAVSETITVTNGQDTAGHSILGLPYAWGFATVGNVPPTIAMVSQPAAVVTAAGPYAVRARINDPAKAGIEGGAGVKSITGDTLYYRVNGGAWTAVLHGAVRVDTFDYQLPAVASNSTVNYYLAARDDGGARTLSPAAGSYGFYADTVAPRIVYQSPSAGQTGIVLSAPIVIGFSEPVNTGSFLCSVWPDPAGWVRGWNARRDTVTLTHGSFQPGVSYSVDVLASDTVGIPLAAGVLPNPWTFSTIPQATVLSTAWSGGVYQLISAPLDPADSGCVANLGDDLGAYSDTTWRMFGYTPGGGFRERPALRNGAGYWLSSADNATIDIPGTRAMGLRQVAVDSGWNLIGAPFDTAVGLGMIGVHWADSQQHYYLYGDSLVNDYVRQRLWRYVDGTSDFVNNGQWLSQQSYDSTSRLSPWAGYAVFATRRCTLDVQRMYTGALLQQARPPVTVDWELELTAESGPAADRGLMIGVSPQARAGYDRLDAEKPPLVSSSIKAYLWQAGRPALHYDYRPAAGTVEWPLVVETRRADQTFTLSYRQTGVLPAGQHLYLADRRSGRGVEIAGSGAMGYSGSRELTILCSDRSIGDLHLQPLVTALEAGRPNPFRERAAIQYQLSRPGRVELAVYNVAGQRVKVLVDERRQPGYYTALWDGRDQSQRGVASGVYLVRLISEGETLVRKLVKIR